MIKLFSFKRTIRTDIIMLLSLSIIVPFLIITVLYISNVKQIIDNDVVSYQKAIIIQSKNSIQNIFDSVKIAQRATMGKIISDYIPIAHDSSLKKGDVEKLKDLIGYLYVIDNANPYINGIYVIFESDYIVSSRNGVRDNILLEKEWIDQSWKTEGQEIYTGTHLAEYNVAVAREEYDTVLSLVQVFELPHRNGVKVLLQIDIDISAFQDFISAINYEEQIPMFLWDFADGRIMLENSIYQEYSQYANLSVIPLVEEIKKEKIYLHAFIRKDQILTSFTSAIMGTTIIISLIVLLSLITAVFFSRTITAPLHQLYLCMQKVGQGDFSPRYPKTQYRELAYLINRFQTMVSEVDGLIATVVSKENETAEAKLHALQAKINPHFLYNTLDVIRGIALSEGNRDISDMTLSLSRLFRYNVGNLEENASLGSEIEYIHNYLQIQKFRFGDRIKVEIHIEPELNKALVTRFVLQPIIENAFKYGLEIRGKGGFLNIQAVRETDLLIISILDNGPGIEPDKLRSLNNSFSLEPHVNSLKSAHGLDNVNLRIKLAFGNSYGLSIDSDKNLWTKVTVKIPYIVEKDNV